MLFTTKIALTEPEHKYYDLDGNQYMSFSELYGFLEDAFDAKKMAYFTGGKSEQGMIAKLDEWDAKREGGIRLDKALTEYAKTGKTSEIDFEEAVKLILAGYRKPSYEQLICYNDQYQIAGTLDKLTLSSNRKDSKFTITDFKGFEDAKDCEYDQTLFMNRGWLKAPFEHLPKNKYTKICIQLSLYAFMVEMLTDKKCEGLYIHVINPESCKCEIGGKPNIRDKKVPVPYLKNDILILLETFKEKIKEKLVNKNEFVI